MTTGNTYNPVTDEIGILTGTDEKYATSQSVADGLAGLFDPEQIANILVTNPAATAALKAAINTNTFATLAGTILTMPDGQVFDLTSTDTSATISGAVITFADGTVFDASSVDTDTFTTLSGTTLTLPDGQTFDTSSVDTKAVISGGVITFASGDVFNLSELNETLSLDSDGVTVLWDDAEGGGSVPLFKSGNISTAPGNSVSRHPSDNKLFTSTWAFQDLEGTQEIVLDPARDDRISLRPGGNGVHNVYTLPDGPYDGKEVILSVRTPYAGTATLSTSKLRVLDAHGYTSFHGSDYLFFNGETLRLIWANGEWRSSSTLLIPKYDVQTLFIGTATNGAIIAPGYNNIPMDAIFDPLNNWNATTHLWNLSTSGPQTTFQIDISLTGLPIGVPTGAFTHHKISTKNKPMPLDPIGNFGYHYSGLKRHSDVQSFSSLELKLNVNINACADQAIFSAARAFCLSIMA